MLLETDPAHPRFVAYDVLANEDIVTKYTVRTVLHRKGRVFQTTVWHGGTCMVAKIANTCRNRALEAHQNMLDKYTFLHWTE